jgi:2-phosphoglycerate kinase
MLLALVGVLYFVPGRSGDSKSAIASRLAAVEAKLAVIDHEELRELMRHEIGLLRLELEMTRSAEGRP